MESPYFTVEFTCGVPSVAGDQHINNPSFSIIQNSFLALNSSISLSLTPTPRNRVHSAVLSGYCLLPLTGTAGTGLPALRWTGAKLKRKGRGGVGHGLRSPEARGLPSLHLLKSTSKTETTLLIRFFPEMYEVGFEEWE